MSGQALLGIAGLTPGGLGIWIGLFSIAAGVAGWWIKGIPDRKRADTEGVTAESKATEAVIKLLREEVDRMNERVKKLEDRVGELEHEKRGVTAERDTAIGERDAARAEVARLSAINLGQGQVRQEAATIVAIERAQDAARKGKA